MNIPDRLKDRPMYAGFPVPYTALVDDKGVPDFKTTDMRRWMECAKDQLCAICGQKLDYWVWFIGGPSSTSGNVYFDGAMHQECCCYSAQTCPHLRGEIGYATHLKPHAGVEVKTIEFIDPKAATEVYATKRRRDQTKIVRNGDSLMLHAGPEVERIVLREKKCPV